MSGKYSDMTDEQLAALEERLYDLELDGVDTWFERDDVLWEMNKRQRLLILPTPRWCSYSFSCNPSQGKARRQHLL